MKTKLILSLLAFLTITTVAAAQNNRMPSRQRNLPGRGVAYVDTNKNGLCDIYENSVPADSIKRPGNRRCCGMGQGQRGIGRGQGRRLNFVDADKNGVCDFYEAPAKK